MWLPSPSFNQVWALRQASKKSGCLSPLRSFSDMNRELKIQIVTNLAVASLTSSTIICTLIGWAFSVWNTRLDPTVVRVQMPIPSKTSAFTFAVRMHLCYLLFCGQFIFCGHMELCKQIQNPGTTVVIQLVWATPRERNTWLLMRQILSHCAFFKTPALCHQNVRLMALVLPLQSTSFCPLCWGPRIQQFLLLVKCTPVRIKKPRKAFAVLMASGSPEMLHVMFPSFPSLCITKRSVSY